MGIPKTIPPEALQKIKKILLIQFKPFGDVLLNTGYMPTLRRHFPRARIDYLVMRPYRIILEDNPWLDHLIIMEKKKKHSLDYYAERLRIILLVRKQKYDVVVDQLRGTGSAQITLLSGAPYRLGWQQKRWRWVYNYRIVRDNLRYYSRSKFDLLNPLGITEQEHNTYYRIRPESVQYIDRWIRRRQLENEKLVVISPASPVAAKQWSSSHFAQLADLILSQTEYKVILLWGPGEKELSQSIAAQMKNTPIIAPPTNFNQAGALLQKSEMYIGNDGGINHLAVALETPSIAIFGPRSNPKKWVAWHKKIHLYLRDWDFKDRTDNRFNIAPQAVFAKFREFFRL